MVPKSGRYYGLPLNMGRVVAQVDPVYLTVFNIMVNAVVMAVTLSLCGPQESQHGLGWKTGEHNIVFYVDDGCVTGRNPVWVQKN